MDFGTSRPIHSIALYFLDDGEGVVAPQSVAIERWVGDGWEAMPGAKSTGPPEGHRANWYTFPEVATAKVRAVMKSGANGRVGLTEFEAWGRGTRPVSVVPPETGNVALKAKVTASFTSGFDNLDEVADGIVTFAPEPRNRWTSYESPNAEDSLVLDFGAEIAVGRVDLMLYDDGGGVRAPRSYRIQVPEGEGWKDVANLRRDPPDPAGGAVNVATFDPVVAGRVRVVFLHREGSRSGVTEVEVRGR